MNNGLKIHADQPQTYGHDHSHGNRNRKRKRNRKRGAGLLSLLLLAALLLCSCGSASADSQAGTADGSKAAASGSENTSSGTDLLVFGDAFGPSNLDVAESWNSWYLLRYGIAETLYILDEDLNPQPNLAVSCEMTDELTWVITLRDGVTFQNGVTLDAQAVKDCWERTLSKNARMSEILYIDTIEADGLTLTVTTTKAVPAFTSSLCEPLTAVVYAQSEDIEYAPVGTGPYMVESFESGDSCTVVCYEDYWGGTPGLSSAVFEVITDTQSLVMALQSGDIDVAVSIPAASLSLFEENDDYTISETAGSRGQVLFMNYENSWIQDLAIRQALSMIIDKESYASVINYGASVAATGLYPDFTDYGAEEGYSYDPEAAAQILADAGYEDTNGDGYVEAAGSDTHVSLRLVTYTTRAELSSYCEELSAQAAKIGIEITLEVYEDVSEQQSTGDFDLMLISFTMMPTGDPQYFADLVFKTDGSSNYGGYSNETVDALIELLDVEFDTEERILLTLQIQEEILADAGFIVIGHSDYYYIMNSSVQNLTANPSEYYLLDMYVTVE